MQIQEGIASIKNKTKTTTKKTKYKKENKSILKKMNNSETKKSYQKL